MKQPRARSFVETSEKRGTQWCRVAIVKCRDCGATESINIRAAKALLPPIAISKKFGQKGWEIGANEQWDMCPHCVETRDARAARKPNLKLVENVMETATMKAELTKPAIVPVAPRVMQRDDRRIVFEKLNEVYLDEKRGYDTGWSDHKVSIDLGVPRVWVEQVREEMFGPVNTNADMDEFRRGVAELGEIKSKIEAVKAKVAEYQRMIEELELSVLAEKVAKLEKLGAEIKKHIP